MCPCCDKASADCVCEKDCDGCDCQTPVRAQTIMYSTPATKIW